jgi:hypothetical protein
VARIDRTSPLGIKSGENTSVNHSFLRLLPLTPRPIRIRAVIGVLLSAIITNPIAAQDTVAGAPPSSGGTAAEIGAAILRAESAMTSEDWPVAAAAWAEVGRLDPTLAGAAYNQGVARYRAGAFEKAAESFQKSAELGDANLAAQSMYNEGTARYAEALQRLDAAAPGGNDPTAKPALAPTADPLANPSPPADPMKETIKRVEDSLSHFRDAIDADQGNRDARVNAELAARLLRQLREVQQQQQDQQQQDQQPQDQQPQDQQPQDQQQQDQQQQDQQPQDQQQQDQQQQDQQPQDQQPQDQEPQDQEQETQEPGTSEEKDGESEDATADGEPSSEDADASAEKPRMTKEEAERLLQSVRDKERQRRQEKAKKDAAGPRTPVKKDW